MKNLWPKLRGMEKLEFIALLGLVFSFPLFETPKTILFVAYVMLWVINHFRRHEWGGRWNAWDTVITLWLLGSIAIAIHAAKHGLCYKGLWDYLRFIVLCWLLIRSDFSKQGYQLLLGMVLISTMLALLQGYFVMYLLPPPVHSVPALELHAVGQVNHSAIYLILTWGLALSLLFAYWKQISLTWKMIGILLLIILGQGLIIGASRACVGMMGGLMILWGGLIWPRVRVLSVLVGVGLILSLGAIWVTKPYIVSKVSYRAWEFSHNHMPTHRSRLRRMAYLAWLQKPIFGWGARNFRQLHYDQVQEWAIKRYGYFDQYAYYMWEGGKPMNPGHAHNLYFNTLAEGGLAGLLPLLAFLILWAIWLWKHYPRADADALAWALWGASLNAFLITVIIGWVNTTLHHEHALLALLLMGLAVSYGKKSYNLILS